MQQKFRGKDFVNPASFHCNIIHIREAFSKFPTENYTDYIKATKSFKIRLRENKTSASTAFKINLIKIFILVYYFFFFY